MHPEMANKGADASTKQTKTKPMRLLQNWNPIQELEAVQNQFLRALDSDPCSSTNPSTASSNKWAPRVDILENNNGYEILAELPGVEKDDVEITVENGVLAISGQRSINYNQDEWKQHRSERYTGSFGRSFSIPEDAVDGEVGADYQNGVLRISLKKCEAKKPKRVEVKIR